MNYIKKLEKGDILYNPESTRKDQFVIDNGDGTVSTLNKQLQVRGLDKKVMIGDTPYYYSSTHKIPRTGRAYMGWQVLDLNNIKKQILNTAKKVTDFSNPNRNNPQPVQETPRVITTPDNGIYPNRQNQSTLELSSLDRVKESRKMWRDSPNIVVKSNPQFTSSNQNQKFQTQEKSSTPKRSKQEVIDIQQKLKSIGLGDMLGTTGPNKDGVDGIWGKRTQAAYNEYMKNQQYYDGMAKLSEVNTPVLAVTPIEQPALVNVTPKEEIQVVEQPTAPQKPIVMDRGDIRNLMRYYDINPYNYTGAQRRALRKFLNGDRSQDMSWMDTNSGLYQEFVAPYTAFQKNGGTLVSKNVIERFRNRR